MKLITSPWENQDIAIVLDCGCVVRSDLTMNTEHCSGSHGSTSEAHPAEPTG